MRKMLLGVSALLLTAASAQPSCLILSGDNVISVTINGQPARIKVDPAYAGLVTVNPEVATRARLKPSMIGTMHSVGPVIIGFQTDGSIVDFGYGAEKRRVMWPDRQIVTGADGIAGPNALPWSRLTFTLRPLADGEQVIDLPLETYGPFGLRGTITRIKIGEEDIKVWFSLLQPQSLATAGLGAELARTNGGAMSGPTHATGIRYGIERPVRTMQLATPLLIGGRPMRELGVRMADFGNASDIPEAGAKADPDEIIVTAGKTRKHDYSLLLGRDFLSGCSSLTYDFSAKLIRLSCAAEAQR